MRTVILGNGLLGSELGRQSNFCIISRKIHRIDITKPQSYEWVIREYDQIINCIGYTDTWSKRKEPSWSVNYVGVMDLVDLCNKYEKKLVQISTDYIYANSDPLVTEEDIPVHFNNWYTYSKLLADGYVQARCKDYLLIRTSFKPRPYPWDGAWVGLIGNFDYVDTISSLILGLIKESATGIYNVGTKKKTMFDLALETKNVAPQPKYGEPHDITMNLTKLHDKLPNNNF